MGTVQDIWWNPITAKLHETNLHRLMDRFQLFYDCSHKSYLSLSKYLDSVPERFYSEVLFDRRWPFLKEEESQRYSQLQSLLINHVHEIDKAFLFLSEVKRDDWYDSLSRHPFA